MNLLVTSAARKVWLVEAFRAALAAEGGGQVFAGDVNPLAAALYAADEAVLLPRQTDPDYEGRLLSLCENRQIGLIVPTRDEELPWFAARRARFAAMGTMVLVASPEAVALCQDKRRFAEESGLPVVPLLRPGDPVALPAFARPRTGKGGQGAHVVGDGAALEAAWEADMVVQPLLDWPEYAIDVACDLKGRVLSVVPRRRLRVEAGESVIGATSNDPLLIAAGIRAVGAAGLVGPATVQLFRRGGDLAFIEINPRYGGGAALGFRAGADSPRAYVRLAMGKPVEPTVGAIRDDLYMLRVSRDIYVEGRDLCVA